MPGIKKVVAIVKVALFGSRTYQAKDGKGGFTFFAPLPDTWEFSEWQEVYNLDDKSEKNVEGAAKALLAMSLHDAKVAKCSDSIGKKNAENIQKIAYAPTNTARLVFATENVISSNTIWELAIASDPDISKEDAIKNALGAMKAASEMMAIPFEAPNII